MLLVLWLLTFVPLELPELAVPSRVYARPHRILVGQNLDASRLPTRLRRLGYREIEAGEPRPGEFRFRRRTLLLNRRPFQTPTARGGEGPVELFLDSTRRIASIRGPGGRRLPSVLIEPEIVGEFHGRQREDRYLVPLADMPVQLIDAVLAIEDRRFFAHGGVDLRRIVGALLADLRALRIIQGGSTLTQQLVKNVFLSDERTFARKLREVWLALRVERTHSKDEILEAYLNTIYMGQRGPVSVRGMEAAARHYFGKKARDLALGEAALLAGLIRGPGLYSPFRVPETARARRDKVLAILAETGRISPEQYAAAVELPLGELQERPPAVAAPYFTAWLQRGLGAELPGVDLQRARLDVYTGLDADLQLVAERAVREGLQRLELDFPHLLGDGDEDAPRVQAALIALDPTSGDVLAHVGGREFRSSQFDRATQARRQPGSVFKPIVALAALARGPDGRPRFTLASHLEDEPLAIETPEGEWTPTNYDEQFRGTTDLRSAIELSINVPIARVGLAIGPQAIIDTARRLGIESRLRPVPSLALGAFELSPLEIARAYAVLASGGKRVEVRGYRNVVDVDGRELASRNIELEPVIDPAEVALVTSALQGAVDEGTGRGLRAFGFRGPVAGKTGTTNNFRDAWFVGYTPELVAAVWVGFDDGRSLDLTGAGAALPIFARFILGALGPGGGADFQTPGGVEFVSINRRSGKRSGFGCWGEREIFLTGTAPEERCGPGWFGSRRARVRDESEPLARSDRRPGWLRALDGVIEAIGDSLDGRP